MSLHDIASLGKMLAQFLALFADCFRGAKGQRLLAAYVRGLLSDLQRKNVEAIALKQRIAPRTLQRFLESIKWDHDQVLRRCRQLIITEHADADAIGVIDESGTAKSGSHTVGVKRQYNGNRGKVENAVVNVALCLHGRSMNCTVETASFSTVSMNANRRSLAKFLPTSRCGLANQESCENRRPTVTADPVAKNVRTGEVKYFVSNRVPGRGGWTIRELLRVAFGRWRVEACFREAKEELGWDHFEFRGWGCVHRHLIVTIVAQLYCARVRYQLCSSEVVTDAARLTLEQVRRAADVLRCSWGLPPRIRINLYKAELERMRYHQHRNAEASRCHRKQRLAHYKAMGIDPHVTKSVAPKS